MNETEMKVLVCVVLGIISFVPLFLCVIYKRIHPIEREANKIICICDAWWIGILGTLVFYGFTVGMLSDYEGRQDLFGVVLFMLFTLMAEFCGIYIITWRLEIKPEGLAEYALGHCWKAVAFSEVSRAVYTKEGNVRRLVGYAGREKIFNYTDMFGGFDFLRDYLEYLRKMEHSELRENITVRINNGDIVRNVISVIMFVGLLVIVFVWEPDGVEPPLLCLLIFFAVIALYNFIGDALWRVQLTYDTVYVRNQWGREKAYALRDISGVLEKKECSIIYVGEKKVVKVFVDYANYQLLLERLQYLGVSFYEKY